MTLRVFIVRSWSWNGSDGVFGQVSETGNGDGLETVCEASVTWQERDAK